MKKSILLIFLLSIALVARSQDIEKLVAKETDSSTGDVSLVNKDPIILKSTKGVEVQFTIEKIGLSKVVIYANVSGNGYCADKNSGMSLWTDGTHSVGFVNKSGDNCDGKITAEIGGRSKNEWFLRNRVIKTINLYGRYFPSVKIVVDPATAERIKAIMTYFLND